MAHDDDTILDPITGEPVNAHGHLNQEMTGDPYKMNNEFADIASARVDDDEEDIENGDNNEESDVEVAGMNTVDEE